MSLVNRNVKIIGMAVLIATALGVGITLQQTLEAKSGSNKGATELLNVSYDPTRELYRQISKEFSANYLSKTGGKVTVKSSHGGSAAQARAVLGGLKADVVSLALAYDIDALAAQGLVSANWQERFANHSCPYSSVIVFLVRKGNPKRIRGWDDLVRPGVEVITPSPKTSGGARWNFLAAWGHVTQSGGSTAQAEDFMRRLYHNVPVLDTGARGATLTFVQKNIGDVLIAWENEALLALHENGAGIELVYPDDTLLAEPPVAVVDRNVDEHGTRAAAEAFIRFLYSDTAQIVMVRSGYRPSNAAILEKFRSHLPPVRKPFTLRDVASSWKAAQVKFFDDGGVFDRIYEPVHR